jgi:phosphatidylglycerol---prolipoprotein diacylglyceryl transferase
VLAAIPYTTFPDLPFGLRTFGLMVALGVLIGARLGSDYGERFGVNREDTYRTGTLMVLAGILGSRLTWVATHTDEIDNLVDVIAIWEGGIQFSGGFIAALIVGWPMFRRWGKVQRWHVLNGYAYGLVAGVAIGRIGCYAVGEHFGRQTDFFLGTRYEGGDVREEVLGDIPLAEGMVFHNTSLYEFLTLTLLFLVMTGMIWRARRAGRELLPATLVALFMVYVGIERFLLDTLRVNDERVWSMTGAQWMSLVMVPYGLWLYFITRPKLARLVGPDGRELETEDAASLLAATGGDDEEESSEAPDELAPPEDADAASDAAPDDEADEDSEPEPTEEEPEPVTAEATSSEASDTDDEADEDSEPEPTEEEPEPVTAEAATAEESDPSDEDVEPEPAESSTEAEQEPAREGG